MTEGKTRHLTSGETLHEADVSDQNSQYKDLIWLEGGHGLNGDNVHQFVDVIVYKVLAETYPTDD